MQRKENQTWLGSIWGKVLFKRTIDADWEMSISFITLIGNRDIMEEKENKNQGWGLNPDFRKT
jgi:hypothetical protein